VQTAVDSLVGRTLEGRYRILDRIARGGMSTVYSAVDERLDRLVAVKVMSAALSADPAFTDRFAREARAAARLTHLNVVSVYDQGHDFAADGHHVFLVMELVEGRTLRELLRERGRLSVAEAVSVMEPVLSALASAHRAGLVHRDVKPENILLSDQGVVKVADFGLARAVESDPSNTRTGLMMGTVAYCAPEQLASGVSDPRSDVYSAGIVFFELLTGTPPYKGETAMNVAYQHVHHRVPAPSSRVGGIPEPVDELVVAATDSDPTGRPADAGAFLAEMADLRAALGLPVTPVPPRPRSSPSSPSSRSSRRADRSGDGGSHTEQLRTAALAGSGRHDTLIENDPRGSGPRGGAPFDRPPAPVVIPPQKERRPTSPRRRRRRRALIGLLLVILLGLGAFFGAQALIKWRFGHVPKVDGLSRQEAVTRLRDAGYVVHVQPGPEFSDSIAAGKVLRTRPGIGARLATGKTVDVWLSAGPHYYRIPYVHGDEFPAARRALAGIGPVTVAPTLIYRYSTTVHEGDVIRTTPPAGSQVRSGAVIHVWVSKGLPDVTIPTVAGDPLGQARHALRKAQFHVTTLTEYSDKVQAGYVIGVSPRGEALLGSTVTVRVSRGPHLVTVPSIHLGTPVAQAEQALKDVGLVPAVSVLGGTAGPGTYALYTKPGADEQVVYGSTVTIYAYSM
jgi:serine/threonine protein kinase/beta-lactam-binding protein with PASTA domain